MIDRLAAWVEREHAYGDRHVAIVRALFGLAFLLAGVPEIVGLGYAGSRSGAFFNLPLCDALAAVPPALHAALVYALAPLALAFTVGVAVRPSGLLIAAILVYLLLVDHMGFRHMWFVQANAFALLAVLVPARAVERSYGVFAFRGWVALVYGLAALSKMNPGFLAGHAIEEMIGRQWGTGSAVYQLVAIRPALLAAMAWGGLLAELALPVLLWLRPTRRLAFAAGCGFHLAVLAVAREGPTLHLLMMTSFLLFAGEQTPATLRRNPIFLGWLGLGLAMSAYMFVKYFA